MWWYLGLLSFFGKVLHSLLPNTPWVSPTRNDFYVNLSALEFLKWTGQYTFKSPFSRRADLWLWILKGDVSFPPEFQGRDGLHHDRPGWRIIFCSVHTVTPITGLRERSHFQRPASQGSETLSLVPAGSMSACWGWRPPSGSTPPPPPRTGPHTDGLLATCWASPQISSLSQMVFTRKQTFKTWAEPSPRKTVRAGRPRSRSRGRQKLEGCAVSQADRALESSGAAQPQCGRPVNNYPWTTSNALLIRTLFPINFHIFVHRSPFTIQAKPWSGSVHWLLYVLGYALHICESSFYRAERRCVCLPSRIYPWLWELKLNENWPAHLLFEVSVTLIPKTDKDSTRKETTGCILF